MGVGAIAKLIPDWRRARGRDRVAVYSPEGGAVSAWFNAHSIQRLHNFTRSASLKGVRFENLTPALAALSAECL